MAELARICFDVGRCCSPSLPSFRPAAAIPHPVRVTAREEHMHISAHESRGARKTGTAIPRAIIRTRMPPRMACTRSKSRCDNLYPGCCFYFFCSANVVTMISKKLEHLSKLCAKVYVCTLVWSNEITKATPYALITLTTSDNECLLLSYSTTMTLDPHQSFLLFRTVVVASSHHISIACFLSLFFLLKSSFIYCDAYKDVR